MNKEKTTNKKSSKRTALKDKETSSKSKDKSKDKYQLLNKPSTHNSIESIQNQSSTKATKGSLNDFFDYELNYVESDYSGSKFSGSSSKLSLSSASSLECRKPTKEDLKTVQCEVHCDRFGKSLNKKANKKLQVKSLENLADLNFCEICDASHMKKIVHRPCCPNY